MIHFCDAPLPSSSSDRVVSRGNSMQSVDCMLLIWVSRWNINWSRGVTVSTLDSESSDRGSNPRGTLEGSQWLRKCKDKGEREGKKKKKKKFFFCAKKTKMRFYFFLLGAQKTKMGSLSWLLSMVFCPYIWILNKLCWKSHGKKTNALSWSWQLFTACLCQLIKNRASLVLWGNSFFTDILVCAILRFPWTKIDSIT